MRAFLTLLLVWSGQVNQCSDGRVAALIKELGSDDFEVRTKAHRELDRYPKLPVGHLYWQSKNNKDCEVRKRCRHIYCKAVGDIVSVSGITPTPSIWLLKNEVRFPFGVKVYYLKEGDLSKRVWRTYFDLGRHYYVKARRKAVEIDNSTWRHADLEREATRMLINDLRRGGWSREECKRLLDQMLDSTQSYYDGPYPGPVSD